MKHPKFKVGQHVMVLEVPLASAKNGGIVSLVRSSPRLGFIYDIEYPCGGELIGCPEGMIKDAMNMTNWDMEYI
jgi:hypothetical protein